MQMTSEIEGEYWRPKRLSEALDVLSRNAAVIVSGCTDFYPSHVGRVLPKPLLDVSDVAEMRAITVEKNSVRFGGAVTWTEIAEAKLPTAIAALQSAARQVGSLQVQNRGTIAGNICNASPAADGVPPLLILDAEVELTSKSGVRRMLLNDFIAGYRKTNLRADEILSSVNVPAVPAHCHSAFVKLGARKYLVISIAMVAALVRTAPDGTIVDCRIAVGSASEKALRLAKLENDLIGVKSVDLRPELLRPEHFSALRPISDVRATARYRAEAAVHLVFDALVEAAGI